jgi:hypothetical protein
VNNNPTVQDRYNSSFAWGYPFILSKLAPAPAASPVLASGFNNNSIGYTAYAWPAVLRRLMWQMPTTPRLWVPTDPGIQPKTYAEFLAGLSAPAG